MQRANNNIPCGAKAIRDLLWPSALACGQAVSLTGYYKVRAVNSLQLDAHKMIIVLGTTVMC